MDIQVSSNLERLIYELLDNDGRRVAALLGEFRTRGRIALPPELVPRLRESWHGESVTDDETLAVMRQVHEESGIVLDPHTAVGVAAARRRPDAMPRLVMATAHPAKFPDAVEQATGSRPALPDHLADLYDRDERYEVLPNDLGAVQRFVRSVGRSQ